MHAPGENSPAPPAPHGPRMEARQRRMRAVNAASARRRRGVAWKVSTPWEGALLWPATTLITGAVRPGPPPGGHFVTGGAGSRSAGIDYVSPGYVTR